MVQIQLLLIFIGMNLIVTSETQMLLLIEAKRQIEELSVTLSKFK